MHHPKPVERSRLSEVDGILMPFFDPSPPSHTAEIAATPSADTLHGEVSAQSPDGTDDMDHRRQATPYARGQSDPSGARGGARGRTGCARHGGASTSSECCSPDTVEEYDESRTHRPPAMPIPRPEQGQKRIKLTGDIGEFLGGPDVWGDLTIMEAERTVGQAAAGQEGANDNNLAKEEEEEEEKEEEEEEEEEEKEEEEEEETETEEEEEEEEEDEEEEGEEGKGAGR